MTASVSSPARLLCEDDRAPVEVINPDGKSPFLLTCEHAGRAIPAALGDLGVDVSIMRRHIAYDIGAEQLAKKLSEILDATLILQPYSRLVIDCNRPFEADDCIPAQSDGTLIPSNCGLSELARKQRFENIHRPFHREISRQLDLLESTDQLTALISIHSFTPELASDPQERPWHIGLLHGDDDLIARGMMLSLREHAPELNVAYNEPYQIDAASDYTIPVHAEERGLPGILLEIRNDQLGTADEQSRYASLLSIVLGDVLNTIK